MKNSISIIIVTYNSKNFIPKCIESIYSETVDINFEIIIIDNGSHDGTIELIEKEYPGVTLIRNKCNVGFAAANNLGMQSAKGDYILLLNPDTEICDGAIQKTYAFFKTHPSAGIVGCLLRYPDKKIQQSVSRFPSVVNSLIDATFFYKIFPKSKLCINYHVSNFDYTKDQPVDCVSGAFLMFRKNILDVIGCLDEQFFMYSEEIDFCYRAQKRGIEVWFTSNAEIIHHWGGMKDLTKRSMIWVQRSQVLFYQKHFAGLRLYVLLLIKYVGLLIRILGYFMSGALLFKKYLLVKSWYSLSALYRLLTSKWRYDRNLNRKTIPWVG